MKGLKNNPIAILQMFSVCVFSFSELHFSIKKRAARWPAHLFSFERLYPTSVIPLICCQCCQFRSKGSTLHVSQVTSAWHSESKSQIKRKWGRGFKAVWHDDDPLLGTGAARYKRLRWIGVVFLPQTSESFYYIPLRSITTDTCSLKQNLYPWFKRHLQCISFVVITRNSIRRNRWRPRPNWKA